MSVKLYRITWAESGGPEQQWFATRNGALSHIRVQQEIESDFSPVVEELVVPTGARQLARWLNEHCDKAKRVTPGPKSKAA